MEVKMVLFLPRDAASVPVSRQVLDSCLQTLGVTPDTRADIALALSEACANVIQHAGPGEEYEVQVSAKNCLCAIEVVNTSSGDSGLAPDGSGGRQDGVIAVSGGDSQRRARARPIERTRPAASSSTSARWRVR